MNVIRRWREYGRQYGFTGLLVYLIARSLQLFWESCTICILVRKPPISPLSAKVPIQVAKLTADHADLAAISHPDWNTRWADGEICYGAWVEGRCVHYSWVRRANAYIAEVRCVLQIGHREAYIYDCFTSGAQRGKQIFPAVLTAIAQELFAEGISSIWIAVEKKNSSSTRAIERAGFIPAGTVCYRRFGLWRRVTINGESLHSAMRPTNYA